MDPVQAKLAGDGEAIFLANQATIARVIAFVCRRHRLSTSEADDFSSHVRLKLIEDDYALLRKFTGRSQLSTYLATVVNRLFLDDRIKAWGKWRPSMEARRAGPVGVLLERLLVRDGHSFDVACELLMTRHGLMAPRSQLEQLAGRLPIRMRRRFEGEDVLVGMPSNAPGPDERLAERDRLRVTEQVATALQRALNGLDVQDRVILTMRFVDGRTAKEIAAALGLDAKPLYARMDRLLDALRAEIERAGVVAHDALTMVQQLDLTIDWTAEVPRPGKSSARPSLRKGAQECQ